MTADERSSACIVCATRGGEGSRTTTERAIRLAAETERRLIFLYVVDTAAIEADGPVVGGRALSVAIRSEQEWVGRVLLRIARHHALRSGVAAEIAIREGRIDEEIVRLAREQNADTVILGASRGAAAGSSADEGAERLAQEIAEATGAEVLVSYPDVA